MAERRPNRQANPLGDSRSTGPWRTVVGVVGPVKQYRLDADGRIACYLPHTQSPSRAMYVVVRSRAIRQRLAAVTTEIHAIDPDLPLYHIRPMSERGSISRLPGSGSQCSLLSLFAVLALCWPRWACTA